MSVAAGTRFGFYEVIAQIGAGGMGEEYEARDTKLGRNGICRMHPIMCTWVRSSNCSDHIQTCDSPIRQERRGAFAAAASTLRLRIQDRVSLFLLSFCGRLIRY
jgi:hypothetical protein